MGFLFFPFPGRHGGFYLFDLGEAWVPSALIDFQMRYRHPTAHNMKSLRACGNKSLHHRATTVPVRVRRGVGCNKLHWRLRILELYRKNMEPLWGTNPHFTEAPCMAIQRPSGLRQHPQSPWQGPNSEKERLIQTENTAWFYIIFWFSVNYCHYHLLLCISLSVPTRTCPK